MVKSVLRSLSILLSFYGSTIGQDISVLELYQNEIKCYLNNDITVTSVLDEDNNAVGFDIIGDTLRLSALLPAHIYKVNYTDVAQLPQKRYVATKSTSSGDIKTYFNFSIPQWDETDLIPDGTSFSDTELAVRTLIRNAKTSIDYCAYNTNVSSIVGALIDAKARGVKVRVIVERENSNTAFNGSMPFAILRDYNEGLMHNKFIVVDADDAQGCYVVNGSTNFTQGQMSVDPNNMMIIQDQTLGKAYTKEFEEMWGSNTDVFNLSQSRFGNRKEDNTPHEFVIGDVPCELYFSPSDNTAFHINDAIKSADHSIDLGLLIFTYFESRDALVDRLRKDVKVRGIIEDIDNSQNVVSLLRANGANIEFDNSNTIYHHKMAIIDGGAPDSDPTLVTGSHNWTFSAQNFNDENTMIFRDSKLADLYRRAFSYHWQQLSTGVLDAPKYAYSGRSYLVSQSNSLIKVIPKSYYLLYDIAGQLISKGTTDSELFDTNRHLTNRGLYIMQLFSNNNTITIRILKN